MGAGESRVCSGLWGGEGGGVSPYRGKSSAELGDEGEINEDTPGDDRGGDGDGEPASEAREAELREMFARFDRDGSGTIDSDEYVRLIKELYVPPEAEVDELLAKFGDETADGEGYLDRDAFGAALSRHHVKYATDKYRSRVDALFRKHDKDGDGRLSGPELVGVVREFLTVPPSVRTLALSVVDGNGDGEISFDEFRLSADHLQASLQRIWDDWRLSEQARMDRTLSFRMSKQEKKRRAALRLDKRKRNAVINDDDDDQLERAANEPFDVRV